MFDHKKLSKVLKSKKITSQRLLDELDTRGIEITIDGIKQYRSGKVKNPKYETLEEIADICGVSLIEFFSNADEQKEQIALEEVTSKPDKYSATVSKAFMSSVSKELSELINLFPLLDIKDQKQYLDEIKEKVMLKKKVDI